MCKALDMGALQMFYLVVKSFLRRMSVNNLPKNGDNFAHGKGLTVSKMMEKQPMEGLKLFTLW